MENPQQRILLVGPVTFTGGDFQQMESGLRQIADRIGAVLVDDRAQALGYGVECGVPAHWRTRRVASEPHFRLRRARLRITQWICAQMQRAALGAQFAEIGGISRPLSD